MQNKTRLLRTFITVTAAALVFGASVAQADSYLGVLVGPSFVDHNGGTDFDIGGHLGTTLTPGFSLGLYGTHQSLSSTTISSSGETILAVDGFTSSSIFGGSSSENDFVWGPAVGFNIPLGSPAFTIGAEANVLFLEATNTVTFVNILGTVTIHF
jgi:hypothetical protein